MDFVKEQFQGWGIDESTSRWIAMLSVIMKYRRNNGRCILTIPWNNEMCVTPPCVIVRAKSAAISDKGKAAERQRCKVTGLMSRPG